MLELSNNGFEIYITSDYGNISSVGQGRIQKGLAVDRAGDRVRIYEKSKNYAGAVEGHKAFKWSRYGLPGDYNFIICEDNLAYCISNEKQICHGGKSIEEDCTFCQNKKRRIIRCKR